MILPPKPHVPGRTPRPPEALFEPLQSPLSADLSPSDLLASAAFHEGLRAFRMRYYWEAHELWEAVWMALPPAGPDRLRLRGVIQLANAGLKGRMGRPTAARRILALADAALAEADRRGGAGQADLAPAGLAGLRAQAAAESGARDAL